MAEPQRHFFYWDAQERTFTYRAAVEAQLEKAAMEMDFHYPPQVNGFHVAATAAICINYPELSEIR